MGQANAYDADRNPFQRWEKDGLLRYFDKQKAPSVTGSFQPRLTGLPGDKGRSKILTEKQLAGYRKATPSAFSRAASQSAQTGMPVEELQSLATGIAVKNPRMPKVNVLADPSKAPKALRHYIAEQGAENDVDGAMHDGELYLFASGLTDALRAEHVLAEHEAAHFGLRAILGDSLTQAMNLIYANNGAVRKAATEMQRRGKLSDAAAVEEVIVDLPSAQLARLKGWRKVAALARDWLASHGFTAMAGKIGTWLDGTLSDQQRADLFVADLVRGARAYVAGKGRANAGAKVAGTRLSATLADDLARQEKWLMAEAKERGYKDIEDLLEKNYPVFEKLAELWRKKHPEETLLSRGQDAYAKAVLQWQEAMKRTPASNTPLASAGTSVDMPTPTIYQALGVKASILSLPVRYMQGIREKHADLPATVLRDLPKLLSDPLLVLPYQDGSYRAVVDAATAKGEPIVVGISSEGRVQTVTPIHSDSESTGAQRLAAMAETTLSKVGVKVYARNKEALMKIRASRGIGLDARDGSHAVPSAGAVPATIA